MDVGIGRCGFPSGRRQGRQEIQSPHIDCGAEIPLGDLEAANLVAGRDPERRLEILGLHRTREFGHELGRDHPAGFAVQILDLRDIRAGDGKQRRQENRLLRRDRQRERRSRDGGFFRHHLEIREQKFHLPPRRGPDLVAIPAHREMLAEHRRLDANLVGKLHLRLERRAFHFLRQAPPHIRQHQLHLRRPVRTDRFREKHT